VPNGKRLPLHDERWEAAGKYGHVGWHTFRHTYRSWLDDTGAPIDIQQKTMRHAQVAKRLWERSDGVQTRGEHSSCKQDLEELVAMKGNVAEKQKNPTENCWLLLRGVIWGWRFRYMVAGVGFEPTTFGL
jgi:hypothetical protein